MKTLNFKNSVIALVISLVTVSCGGGNKQQQVATGPNVSGKIWLSENHPEFLINEAMDVDWREIQLSVAQNNNGQVFFSDKKLGLKFSSNSLSIMLGTANSIMYETLDKFDYSFDNDEFYIKLQDKTVFSSRYEYMNEKLTLIITKPNETETIVFQLNKD